MEWATNIDELLDDADDHLASSPPALSDAIDALERSAILAPGDPPPPLRLTEALCDARTAAIAFAVRGVWMAPEDAGE